MNNIQKLFVERKESRDDRAKELAAELRIALRLTRLESLRILTLYEISGLDGVAVSLYAPGILVDPCVDRSFSSLDEAGIDPVYALAREYLPGTFDQRADSAERCLRLLYPERLINVHRSDVFVPAFSAGDSGEDEMEKIQNWLINPVESRTKNLLDSSPEEIPPSNTDITLLHGFRFAGKKALETIKVYNGIGLNLPDMELVRDWFRDVENRDPTLVELKVLDTYWSDHCRHTTFETELTEIELEFSPDDTVESKSVRKDVEAIEEALSQWDQARLNTGRSHRPRTLMDLATVAAREAQAQNKLEDWDVSEEINACTIRYPALINGRREEWLLSFKNETHNHPTEIEPFGGASTCIGGAVRDPLSGRSFVYQALRVSGGGNPLSPGWSTRPGKLPQRLIAHGAADGYASYGNQLGLATTMVREHYHPGYEAKRLECGAVMGATPASHVVRRKPEAGDVVILVGGRTGRDGIGGATGSSVVHSSISIEKAGAEVQKGNAPEERKLQRLFRRAEAARLIRRCNDFGAGGVAVAVGELADGLDINLDAIKVKYEGLNAMELALSESQERMAVVVAPQDAGIFMSLAEQENLDSSIVARITGNKRMRMHKAGRELVNLPRELLDTHGVRRKTPAKIILKNRPASSKNKQAEPADFGQRLRDMLASPQVAMKLGLEERFDGSVGGTTVIAPRGGVNQLTPAEASVHLLPADGKVESVSVMAVGFDPYLAEESPFRGGQYALIEAISRSVAVGGDWRGIRFSLQEYFGSVDRGVSAWGAPLAALLGALTVERSLSLPAIGGKDSMSGSFHNLDVPPTIIAFAASGMDASHVLSAALPTTNLTILLLSHRNDCGLSPDFQQLIQIWDHVSSLNTRKRVKAAATVGPGGWPVKLVNMALGNDVGIELFHPGEANDFKADYGAILLGVDLDEDELKSEFKDFPGLNILGKTINKPVLRWTGGEITLREAESLLRRPFTDIWPVDRYGNDNGEITISSEINNPAEGFTASPKPSSTRISRPRVFIPVFAGTNGEDDARRAFTRVGALPKVEVFRDHNPEYLEAAIKTMAKNIANAQILYISGGFSAGDEPDGAGKYIAAILRYPRISDAIDALLERGGLVLGICNGFQALIKSGWLVEGRAALPQDGWPSLVRNRIGHHVARICRTVSDVKHGVAMSSPWLNCINHNEIHVVPVSHGEGRFRAAGGVLDSLEHEGRLPFRYCNLAGIPTMAGPHNPNGSDRAVEAMLSPCGRVLGKMGHSERWREGTFVDIPGMENPQPILESGVAWFR